MAAAIEGREALARKLLQRSANPDLQCTMGGTALMGAASQGHVEVIHRLLEAGADASLKNASGHTAQDVARQFNRTMASQILREHAAAPKEAEMGWRSVVFGTSAAMDSPGREGAPSGKRPPSEASSFVSDGSQEL